jgi:hypothetical protein
MKTRQLPPIPTPEQHIEMRRRMFAEADRRAEERLFSMAAGLDGLLNHTTDDVYELMKLSHYWNEAEYNKTGGDTICACTDAALLLGLAFGLRLRGLGGVR